MRRGELLYLAVVVALVGGTITLDRVFEPVESEAGSGGPGRFVSAGWYCPSPAAEDTQSQMATANLGRQAVSLRTSAIGQGKESPTTKGELAARTRFTANLSDFDVPEPIGVLEAFGDATLTDISSLGGGKGASATNCTDQPWDRWLFASASTSRGRDHHLIVANPFEEEAVIAVTMMSSDENTQPARLKDYLIPALSQKSIFLSEFITEKASFGLEVRATHGRVVAAMYAQAASRDGVRGTSLVLGVRGPSTKWTFADGEVPAEGEETLMVMNPSNQEALIQVVLATDQEQVSPPALQELAVPAGRHIQVKLSEFLPRGSGHLSVLTSANGVPVVAERQTVLGGGRGYESSVGVSARSDSWGLPVGSFGGGSSVLAIANTGGAAATVRIRFITDKGEVSPPQLSSVLVAPGRRSVIDVTPFLAGTSGTALIDTLSGSVVVEHRASHGPPIGDFFVTSGVPV